MKLSTWIGIGAGIGAAIGVPFHHIAIGFAFGVAGGIGLWAGFKKPRDGEPS